MNERSDKIKRNELKESFWRVVRQDSHGNRFVYSGPGVKSTHLSRQEAETLVRELEKKHGGHKQDFFSERMDDPGLPKPLP
jgi:hypothetical protein